MLRAACAFYHAYLVNDWPSLVREQIGLLREHLPEVALACSLVCENEQIAQFTALVEELWPHPIDLHFHGGRANEIHTLRALKTRVIAGDLGDDDAILYFHTKGITYPPDRQGVVDWRRMMQYFLIEQAQQALKRLEPYDVVGCNFAECPPKPWHYSGNFWWARASYLRRLPDLDVHADRGDAELWVTSLSGRFGVLHDSDVNHYDRAYPRSTYVLS